MAEDADGECDEEETELRLWSSRVWTFYTVYFPPKAAVEGCRETSKKFQGREVDLFTALYHKYEVVEEEQTYHTDLPPGWREFK